MAYVSFDIGRTPKRRIDRLVKYVRYDHDRKKPHYKLILQRPQNAIGAPAATAEQASR